MFIFIFIYSMSLLYTKLVIFAMAYLFFSISFHIFMITYYEKTLSLLPHTIIAAIKANNAILLTSFARKKTSATSSNALEVPASAFLYIFQSCQGFFYKIHLRYNCRQFNTFSATMDIKISHPNRHNIQIGIFLAEPTAF